MGRGGISGGGWKSDIFQFAYLHIWRLPYYQIFVLML